MESYASPVKEEKLLSNNTGVVTSGLKKVSRNEVSKIVWSKLKSFIPTIK